MEDWQKLEIEYAKKLRESTNEDRSQLYFEAYTNVSKLKIQTLKSNNPEGRTAGTNKDLIRALQSFFTKKDTLLEIGCGRGYSCLNLAPYVSYITGIEVSKSSVEESNYIIEQNGIGNVSIVELSATELSNNFEPESFSGCFSIDVLEHLHPDDADDHLSQVYDVIKPGGKLILVVPNILTGPHDLTKDVFPKAKIPLGFHLNETSYIELINLLKAKGFKKFKIFNFSFGDKPIILPVFPFIIIEKLAPIFKSSPLKKYFNHLLGIKLIAYK